MAQQRDRGRYLSNKGLKKLHKALDDTFLEEKWTSEKLSEWTDPANNEEAVRSVSKDTVRKIVNRRGKCDIPYIEALFQAFGVELEKDDLTIEPPITPTPDPPPIPKPEEDPNFIGRESAIADLDNLVKQGAKCILILSRGGEGKTALAQKYLQQRFDTVLEFLIAKEQQNITSVHSLIQEKLRKLGEEPGRDLGVSLDRLRQKLQSQRIGVLIDNLEPALDGAGRLIEPHRGYLELLRILTDVTTQSITLITSREPLREGLDVTLYPLPGLSQETWQKYFKNQGIATNIKTLHPLHTAYGGNALAMKTICGAIRHDPEYQGNVQKYWREGRTEEGLLVEDAIDNLIKEQFERLKDIYPEVYHLLCRMGCYRYQDVPAVPKQGLYALLWDIASSQHKKIVKALRNYNLIDLSDSVYKLHPVVRQEAIARLRKSPDWEITNCQAAKFWTNSVKTVNTEEDALKALEAYYHYLNIKHFNACGKVLISEPKNNWAEIYPLGCILYQFGLFDRVIQSIKLIIDRISDPYVKGRLYSILGDCSWMKGEVHEAIHFHQESKQLALYLKQEEKEPEILSFANRLEVAAVNNIALCQLDLWEIKESLENFKKVSSYESHTNIHIYTYHKIKNSWFCMALLYSILGDFKSSRLYIDKCIKFKGHDEFYDTGWGRGNRDIFLAGAYKNLKMYSEARNLYKIAENYSEISNYPLVKAKALIGIAELYRIQNKFKDSLYLHEKSIHILNEIHAQCDLAEAYYQLGLTHQAINNSEESEQNFERAIALWKEIGAPKQIERVEQARRNQ